MMIYSYIFLCLGVYANPPGCANNPHPSLNVPVEEFYPLWEGVLIRRDPKCAALPGSCSLCMEENCTVCDLGMLGLKVSTRGLSDCLMAPEAYAQVGSQMVGTGIICGMTRVLCNDAFTWYQDLPKNIKKTIDDGLHLPAPVYNDCSRPSSAAILFTFTIPALLASLLL